MRNGNRAIEKVPTTPVTGRAVGSYSTECAAKFLGNVTSKIIDATNVGVLHLGEKL